MFKNGDLLLKKRNTTPIGVDNNCVILFLNADGKLSYVDDKGYVHVVADGQTIPQMPIQLQYDAATIPADYDSLMVSTNTFFGDGSDGSVVVPWTLELDRDYYFDTLTLNAGSVLKSNGFRIFVKSALILNGGVIQNNGNSGKSTEISSENYFVGGIGGTLGNAGSLGQSSVGGNGSTATLSDGPNTTPSATQPLNNGGKGGFGGDGGAGQIGKGGKSLNDRNGKKSIIRNVYLALQGSRGPYLINGGLGGDGGAAGGGDGMHFGAGGGGGGAGGGVIQIIAKTVVVTPNAAKPSIVANGGNGENGKSALIGNCGGGGGGSAGGGGFIQIFSLTLPKQDLDNLIVAKSGIPGKGGTKIGNASNGFDGKPGQPGTIECINVKTGEWNVFIDSSNSQLYK